MVVQSACTRVPQGYQIIAGTLQPPTFGTAKCYKRVSRIIIMIMIKYNGS